MSATTRDHSWLLAGSALTVLWVLRALLGGAGPLSSATAAAVGAGATAVLMATRPPHTWASPTTAGAGLVTAPVALAASAGGKVVLVALSVVVGAVLMLGLDRRGSIGVASAAALVGVASVVGYRHSGAWELDSGSSAAASFLLAGAVVLLVVAVRGRWGSLLLLPAGIVGVAAAPHVRLAALSVGLSAAALVALAKRTDNPVPGLGDDPAPAALIAVAVAAAAVPHAHQAALLLAAAGVLAAAFPLRWAFGLATPGAIALASVLEIRGPSVAGWTAIAALVVWVVGVAATDRTDALTPLAWPAGLLAAWLLVAPGTWRWTGPNGLADYGRGAAVAAAVIGLTAVASWVWSDLNRRIA